MSGEEGTFPMDMSERRERIVDFINGEGNVTFAQLKGEFPDVSEMTLRTDLKVLDGQRLIIRVHGGAKSVSFALGTDDLLARRTSRRSAEKAVVARKAAELVHPGCTIFIDSGSTTTAFASVLEDVNLMVFTNSITVASELSRLEKVMTYLVGGRLNRFSMSTIGGHTIETVRGLSFDQAFIGTTGYVRERGFTCGSDDEAVFKSSLVKRSHKSVMLMDASKEGRVSTFRFGGLRDFDTIVTDGTVSADFILDCEEAKVELL